MKIQASLKTSPDTPLISNLFSFAGSCISISPKPYGQLQLAPHGHGSSFPIPRQGTPRYLCLDEGGSKTALR